MSIRIATKMPAPPLVHFCLPGSPMPAARMIERNNKGQNYADDTI
jgi:hypothetical protein